MGCVAILIQLGAPMTVPNNQGVHPSTDSDFSVGWLEADRGSIFNSKTTLGGAAGLGVLLGLRDIWVDIWKQGQEDELFDAMIEPMAADPATNGEDNLPLLDDLSQLDNEEINEDLRRNLQPETWKNLLESKSKMTNWILFETAMAFAIQAVRAQADEASADVQWRYAAEAKYFLGKLQGIVSQHDFNPSGVALAKKGADARHAENRAMKAQLFEWCASHLSTYRSMDAAALAVIQTVIPVQFRTARSWMAEWKKLQSAGTP